MITPGQSDTADPQPYPPHDDGPLMARRAWRRLLFGLLVVFCLGLFTRLPTSLSTAIFVLLSVGLWLYAIPRARHGLVRLGTALFRVARHIIWRRRATPSLILRDFVLICVLLVLALMLAARQYLLVTLMSGLLACVAFIVAIQAHPTLLRDLRQSVWAFVAAIHTACTPAPRRAGTQPLRGLLALLYAAEIAVVLVSAWDVTGELRANAPDQRLYGNEAEYLTASAYTAAHGLQTYGYIPLWQPWLEHGEPLITSPFSFVLNPISTVPSLLTDGLRGIKLSFAAYILFAGLGGWFLGWELGLGTVGRVLLGLLMFSRGSIHAPIAGGFFQLASSQAYMPWIAAGALATVRDHKRRWPPVLLAVMLTLLFFAGNLWYVLPMLVTVALLGLLHVVGGARGIIDWHAIRRLAFAALLTLGLSAVILIPLWANRSFVNHPEEIGAGARVGLEKLLHFYLYSDDSSDVLPGGVGTYYAYVIPPWFLLLLFVYIPPVLPPLFAHPACRGQWRIWFGGIVLLVLATLWSMGDTALFTWLYEKWALLREWRFVGRALAVGTFWIAVLVALRADALAQFVIHPIWRRPGRGLFLIQVALLFGLSWAAWRAVEQVKAEWGRFGLTELVSQSDDECVGWLRAENPGVPLMAYRYSYDAIYPYIDYEVRQFNIEVAYHALPRPSIYPAFNLQAALPQYGFAWDDGIRTHLSGSDFSPAEGSPTPLDDKPCVYVQNNAYPYAFAALAALAPETLIPRRVSALPVADRKPDRITLWVLGYATEFVIVVVDELAYPGWIARIDGQRAEVVSVGGLIGLIVPPGTETHTVVFQFRPPLFIRCAWITLLTSIVVVLYLLRVDRLIRR